MEILPAKEDLIPVEESKPSPTDLVPIEPAPQIQSSRLRMNNLRSMFQGDPIDSFPEQERDSVRQSFSMFENPLQERRKQAMALYYSDGDPEKHEYALKNMDAMNARFFGKDTNVDAAYGEVQKILNGATLGAQPKTDKPEQKSTTKAMLENLVLQAEQVGLGNIQAWSLFENTENKITNPDYLVRKNPTETTIGKAYQFDMMSPEGGEVFKNNLLKKRVQEDIDSGYYAPHEIEQKRQLIKDLDTKNTKLERYQELRKTLKSDTSQSDYRKQYWEITSKVLQSRIDENAAEYHSGKSLADTFVQDGVAAGAKETGALVFDQVGILAMQSANYIVGGEWFAFQQLAQSSMGQRLSQLDAAGITGDERTANALIYGAAESIPEKMLGNIKYFKMIEEAGKPQVDMVIKGFRQRAAAFLKASGGGMTSESADEVITFMSEKIADGFLGVDGNGNKMKKFSEMNSQEFKDYMTTGLLETVAASGILGGVLGGTANVRAQMNHVKVEEVRGNVRAYLENQRDEILKNPNPSKSEIERLDRINATLDSGDMDAFVRTTKEEMVYNALFNQGDSAKYDSMTEEEGAEHAKAQYQREISEANESQRVHAPEDTAAAVEDFKKANTSLGGKVVFVANEAALPENDRNRIAKRKATGRVEAFVRNDGSIVIVGDKVRPSDVPKKILEEAAHHGIRTVFGEHANPLFDDFNKQYGEEVKAWVTQHGYTKDTVKFNLTTQEGMRNAAHEFIVHTSNLDVKPSWWRKFLLSVKMMLRRVKGFESVRFTDKDVEAFIHRAVNSQLEVTPEAKTMAVTDGEGAKAAVDEKEGTAIAEFSLATWTKEDKEALVRECVQKGIADRKTAQKWVDDISSIAAVISRNKNVLDYDASAIFEHLKSNGDFFYSISEDYSTMCRKSVEFLATVSEIQKRMGKGLSAEQMWTVREMLKDAGAIIPCAACYVNSRKIQVGKSLDKLAFLYPDIPKDVIYDFNRHGELDKYATPDRTLKILAGDKKISARDRSKMKKEGKTMTDLMRDRYPTAGAWLRARGSGVGKAFETRTEFRPEAFIKEITPEFVKRQNLFSGLRSQSWSDFEILHAIDKMHSAYYKALAGLAGHSYTKVPEYVQFVGHTGEMINMSLIPKGVGLDADGNLIFDDVEGMAVKTARTLREKFDKTAGIIAIGSTDKQIRALLACDYIDYVIPYHMSGLQEELRDVTPELQGWEEFTEDGHEGVADEKKFAEYMKNKKDKYNTTAQQKEVRPFEYWDKTKSGKENGKIYTEFCKKNGITPKFQQFANEDGYWKLLVDRKMYDSKGAYIEQQVVKPIFDMEYTQELFAKAQSGEFKGVEKETPNTAVADKFMSGDIANFSLAWHTSPYDFNQFDMDKIGTGEGAQVRGHGLYMAGNRGTAKYYENSLRSKAEPKVLWKGDVYRGDNQTIKNALALLKSEADMDGLVGEPNPRKVYQIIDDTIEGLEHQMKIGDTMFRDKTHHELFMDVNDYLGLVKEKNDWTDEINFLKENYSNIMLIKKTTVYRVDLAPKEEEYLLLDAPLKNQSQLVQDAIRKTEWYKALEKNNNRMDKEKAKKRLDELLNKYSSQFDNLSPAEQKEYEELYAFFHDIAVKPEDMTGEEIYDAIKRFGAEMEVDKHGVTWKTNSAAKATKLLLSLGIRGNKFLDGFSRDTRDVSVVEKDLAAAESGLEEDRKNNAPKSVISMKEQQIYELKKELELAKNASYNYVMFDDKDISIIEKFSLRGYPASQAMAMARFLVPYIKKMGGAMPSPEAIFQHLRANGFRVLTKEDAWGFAIEARQIERDRWTMINRKNKQRWIEKQHPILGQLIKKYGSDFRIKPSPAFKKFDTGGGDWYAKSKGSKTILSDKAAEVLGIDEEDLLNGLKGLKKKDVNKNYIKQRQDRRQKTTGVDKISKDVAQMMALELASNIAFGREKFDERIIRTNPAVAENLYTLLINEPLPEDEKKRNWEKVKQLAAEAEQTHKEYERLKNGGEKTKTEYRDNPESQTRIEELSKMLAEAEANFEDLVKVQKLVKGWVYANIPKAEQGEWIKRITALGELTNEPTPAEPQGKRTAETERILEDIVNAKKASLNRDIIRRIDEMIDRSGVRRIGKGRVASLYASRQKELNEIRKIREMPEATAIKAIEYHNQEADKLINDGKDAREHVAAACMINTFGMLENKTPEQLYYTMKQIHMLMQFGRTELENAIGIRHALIANFREIVIQQTSGGKRIMSGNEADIAAEKNKNGIVGNALLNAKDLEILLSDITRNSKKAFTDSELYKELFSRVHAAYQKKQTAMRERQAVFDETFNRIFGTKTKRQRAEIIATLKESVDNSGVFRIERDPNSLKPMMNWEKKSIEEAKEMLRNYDMGNKGGLLDYQAEAVRMQIADTEERLKKLLPEGFKSNDQYDDDILKTLEKERGGKEDEVVIPTFNPNSDHKEKEVRLTQMTALYMYLMWQQPSIRYKMHFNGWNEKSIEQLKTFIKPEVMALGKFMVDDLADEYHSLDEVYYRMYQTHLPQNPNYFPFRLAQNKGVVKTIEGANVEGEATVNFGSLNSRKFNLSDPSLEDALSVYNTHIAQSEHFKTHAEIARDLRAVFMDRDVAKAITQYHGAEVYTALNMKISDFVQGGNKDAAKIRAIDAFQSLFARARIWWNSVSMIKQIAGTAQYIQDIPVKDFVAGLYEFGKHPIENAKIIMETDYFKNRWGGNANRDLNMLINRYGDSAQQSAGYLSFLDEIASMPTRVGDAFATIVGGWSVYNYHFKNLKADGLSDQAAHKQAMLEFEMSTERTQQSGAAHKMNRYQLDGSFGKVFTTFQSNPILVCNAFIESAVDWKSGRDPKAKYRLMRRAFSAWIIGGFLMELIGQAAKNGLDWDEYNLKRMGKSMVMGSFGSFTPIDAVFEAGVSCLPWFRDYQGTSSGMSDVANVVSSGSKIFNIVIGDDDAEAEEIWKAVERGFIGLGIFTPLAPAVHAGGIMREMRRMKNLFDKTFGLD
jgi:hypothetical protein